MASKLKASALYYAKNNLYVFPTTPQNKIPLTAHGF